jgi:hypothetical protein
MSDIINVESNITRMACGFVMVNCRRTKGEMIILFSHVLLWSTAGGQRER